MIFRKPYAFLIKNFKIIHLILSILMIYTVYKISNVSRFIYDYIDNVANSNIATSYIGTLVFVVLLIIIGISLTLYILMRYKKKPKILYLVNTIVYTIIFFVLFYILLNFQVIEKEVVDPKTIRLLRDITNIILYPEYLFILAMIVRTLGFDIKKFDFKSDIEEMNIDVSDNEEVELNVGVDVEKIKTKGRRQIRELKYYVLENKIFVFTILGVVGFIIIVSLLLNININKVYKEGENVKTNYFMFNIYNSYITSKNDVGNDIGYNNTTYVVIKFNIEALLNDGYEYKLNPSNLLLLIGDNVYTPVTKYYDFFKVIGVGYKNQTIKYKESSDYILVYNIVNDDVNKVKYIRYEGTENKIVQTKKIKINPKNIDKMDKEEICHLNDSIDLSSSMLNGTLKIMSYEINKSFSYEYNYCINSQCEILENTIVSSYDGQLLKLTVENTNDRFNNYDFSNNFIKVKYKIGEDEYTSSLNNKTPSSSTTTMYFNVDNKIVEADSIWLEITIRNKFYKYILK